MGLFDSLYVDCPKCGMPVEYQSKALEDCYCRNFTLETAPGEILFDVMNDPHYCMQCGQWIALIDPVYPPGTKPRPSLRAAKVRTPDDPKTHFQGFKWWPDETPFTYADLEEDGSPQAETKE